MTHGRLEEDCDITGSVCREALEHYSVAFGRRERRKCSRGLFSREAHTYGWLRWEEAIHSARRVHRALGARLDESTAGPDARRSSIRAELPCRDDALRIIASMTVSEACRASPSNMGAMRPSARFARRRNLPESRDTLRVPDTRGVKPSR